VKSWIQIKIRIKVKNEELQMFQMEVWRVCRPVVADLYHFDKEESGSELK
jgi:hypothetical protein